MTHDGSWSETIVCNVFKRDPEHFLTFLWCFSLNPPQLDRDKDERLTQAEALDFLSKLFTVINNNDPDNDNDADCKIDVNEVLRLLKVLQVPWDHQLAVKLFLDQVSCVWDLLDNFYDHTGAHTGQLPSEKPCWESWSGSGWGGHHRRDSHLRRLWVHRVCVPRRAGAWQQWRQPRLPGGIKNFIWNLRLSTFVWTNYFIIKDDDLGGWWLSGRL